MKKYFLINDLSTREYLESVFTQNNYISLENEIEKESIIFIHLQSQKDIYISLEKFKNLKIALLSDTPSFYEGYNLLMKYSNIKAYANTYMATTHYKQLYGMLKSDNNWFYPEFTQEFLSYLSGRKDTNLVLEKLTAKESEVAQLVAKSLKNSEIAEKLNIKERTVKQHLSNIFEKLEIKDRVTLALMLTR